MSEAIITAVISSGATLAVALITMASSYRKVQQKLESTNALLLYRIGELEKKMDKHNHVIERTAVIERDMKTAFNKIDENRTDIRELRDHYK